MMKLLQRFHILAHLVRIKVHTFNKLILDKVQEQQINKVHQQNQIITFFNGIDHISNVKAS